MKSYMRIEQSTGDIEAQVDVVGEALERMALQAQAGDTEARNALFVAQRGLIEILSRRAKGLVRSLERHDRSLQPQDIDQQAFVEFCRLLEDWRPGDVPFTGYMRKLLPWRLLHYVRRSARYRSGVRVLPLTSFAHGQVTTGDEGEAGDPGIEDEASQARIISIESSDTWKHHTRTLEEGLRRAVSMRYGLGLSTGEIAGIEHRSPRSVNRDIRAAIKAIKQNIEEEWENCS